MLKINEMNLIQKVPLLFPYILNIQSKGKDIDVNMNNNTNTMKV